MNTQQQEQQRWVIYGGIWMTAALLMNLFFSTGDYADIDGQADTFPKRLLSDPMPSAQKLHLQDAPWTGENGVVITPHDREYFAAIRATILERIGEYDHASVRHQRETSDGVKRVQVWIYGKDGMQTTVEIEFRKSGEEWRVADLFLDPEQT